MVYLTSRTCLCGTKGAWGLVTSQTTGAVEQGETIEVDEDIATLLVRRRGFEYVDGDEDEEEDEEGG